jgi:ParB family chromosome partitioning protein
MAAEFRDPHIGQMTPIEVEETGNGRFELVYGKRRCRAAAFAGMTEIKAKVLPASSPDIRARRNIMENVTRENLTPFELARSVAYMRDNLKMKNPDIAPVFKVSPSHVSNMHTAYTGLPKPVLADWEKGHPAANIQDLCEVARKGKDDEGKVKLWDELVAAHDERTKTKTPKGKKGADGSSSAGFPVSQKRLGHVIAALSTKGGSPDLSDEVRKWGKALLDYVTQGRETPPAGVPKMEPKGKKDAKEGDE